MDIQSRKIEFIQKFFKIQSEEVLSRLEKILYKEIESSDQEDIEPMTIEEFNVRIDKSMEDSRKGRLVEAGELKAKIEKWK